LKVKENEGKMRIDLEFSSGEVMGELVNSNFGGALGTKH
jgi:hypothetical protein